MLENTSKPFQIVYTIVERPKDGKKVWLRIGAGSWNRDGSLNVRLDAMPTNGQLHIRDYKPYDDRFKRDGGLETRRDESAFDAGGPAFAG